MNVQVSVIVPVYNAGELMFYTVDNLLNQSLKDLELILVDDCSTDDSAARLEERYAGNERVRVIRQTRNGGPGEARNRGIEEARGSYVCFCDSDDEMTPDALQEMLDAALLWDADVVHSSGILLSLADETPGDMLSLSDENWCVVDLDHPSPTKPALVEGTPEELLQSWLGHGLHWSAWNKLYRRDMLMKYHIRFGKMRLAEDQQFCFSCLFWAERYVQLPGARYYYRLLSDSLSRGRATTAFLEKCLRSGFEISRSMDSFGREHPWFREHPESLHEASAFILERLEDNFTSRTWQELGEEAILEDKRIRELFEEYFGEQADRMLKQYCDAHRRNPQSDSVMNMLNSPARLRQLVKEGKLHTLKEIKEKKGVSGR